MEVGGQCHAPAALPPGKTRYPLYRRLGGPRSWSGRVRKISPPTGIRSPDCPARSESLYRLPYPGPLRPCGMYINHWPVKGQCFNRLNDFAARNSERPVKSVRTERPTVGFVCLDFLAAAVSSLLYIWTQSLWTLRKKTIFYAFNSNSQSLVLTVRSLARTATLLLNLCCVHIFFP
jgi:hypothetical protein